jgi:DNA (cytosine-5)-methyltransferase 1
MTQCNISIENFDSTNIIEANQIKESDMKQMHFDMTYNSTHHQNYKFIDLFAGIGGFHLALSNLNAKCVFASEIDKHARETYIANHKKSSPELFNSNNFNEDITTIDPIEIPDFDILCGGFPCQPFSQAGFKKGFEDDRGNLFFYIANIIDKKQPKAFFLENVRHLLKHDNNRTFATIQNIIQNDLGYSLYYKIVKASDFGLPQHRPRIFIVGFKNDHLMNFEFPTPQPLKMSMSDIWGEPCSKEIGFTLRVGGRGSTINDRRNWDSYLVNGVEKRIGSKQGKKMQGFPDDFIFPVSETQAMKQLGNSVAIPAVEATAKAVMDYLQLLEKSGR